MPCEMGWKAALPTQAAQKWGSFPIEALYFAASGSPDLPVAICLLRFTRSSRSQRAARRTIKRLSTSFSSYEATKDIPHAGRAEL
mmetsp:Transcript_66165/g.117218  ORF Transcript_66165/g.117218 Transcript_66165/m.117218 type:complete len:85 (+) Transcript_66165:201-455(+)